MPAPKTSRRQARIQAVQQLYGQEMQGALPPAEGEMVASSPSEEKVSSFARGIVTYALTNLPDIDRLLADALQNWDLRRLGAVDRATLRMAVAEMLAHPEIPPAVTINEAIEIARELASSDSARFANGVLDRVRQEIGRTSRLKN